MTADEYEAITEAEWKVLATTEITHLTDEEKDYLPRAWDEWIARVRRDAAREALDGFKAWRGTRQCPAISPPDPCNRPEGHDEPHAYDIPEGECDWREVDWSDTDIYRDTHYPEEPDRCTSSHPSTAAKSTSPNPGV